MVSNRVYARLIFVLGKHTPNLKPTPVSEWDRKRSKIHNGKNIKVYFFRLWALSWDLKKKQQQ